MEGARGRGPGRGGYRGGRGGGGRGGGGRGREFNRGGGGGRGGRDLRGRGRPQGRSGRSHGDDSRADVRFGFNSLRSMLQKDPDELVLDMTSDRCMSATEALLEQTEMRDDLIVLVFKVLAHACECGTTSSSLQRLLSGLPRSFYLSHHLSSYINRLSMSSKDGYELEIEFKAMLKLLAEVLRKLPSSFADLPIPQLSFAINALVACGRINNVEIQSSVEEVLQLRDEMAEKVKKQAEDARRPRRRTAAEEAALRDEEAPPDDFREMSVIPEIRDVHTEGAIFLRRNKIDGSYSNPEHYLDVQFRLLREDFVRPLRDGIHKMLERIGSAKMGPLQDIRMYHGVKILFPMFTSKGLTHKISFDVSRLRRVRWENSKRLIYGSLLCLSKDKFDTFILATVENRNIKELQEGRVEVRFNDLSQEINLDQTEYQMVETTAYFEAYRHVLEGLKEIEPRSLPFQRYIVSCEKDVQSPAYLRNRMRDLEEMTYDLTPIMKQEAASRSTDEARRYHHLLGEFHSLSLTRGSRVSGKAVRILDMNAWPSAEDLELDSSQLKAVQLALTKEFAIIQGPPGTGKTYIGLKVVRVLLHNKHVWDKGSEMLLGEDDEDVLPGRFSPRPILVVCYTNHALDQFLEGIHEFHPEGIVRVGGRSQSEKMQACSLSELKHKMHKEKQAPREIRRAFFEVHQQLEHVSQQMKSATENLQKCMENLVHENQILNEGHMTEEQYDSMIRPVRDPRTGMITVKSAICHWLGLTANTSDAFETSAFVDPMAIFPFNAQTKKVNVLNPSHKATSKNVHPAQGLDGMQGGSYELQGARDSYIIIPNMENNLLDSRFSMTVVMYVYPMSPQGGPILTFHEQGFIGIQISQDGVDRNGKGVLSATFNRRDGATPQPLSKAVLRLNQWNYIAASYNNLSGFSRLWHNGKMVQEQQNESMEIASHLPVYIGSLNLASHKSFFEGRVSSLLFYPDAIGREQIMAIAGIREEDLEEEEVEEATAGEEEDTDVLYEAGAMEDQRILDVDEVEHFGRRGGTRNLLLADPFDADSMANPQPGQWQIQNPQRQKKRIQKRIKRELSLRDMMTPEEAARVIDVWRISQRDKWRLYRYWVEQLCRGYRLTVERYQKSFEDGAQRLREIKSLEDLSILKKATIIGMTTTGAAKYRNLIQKIKPRITVVEEAAEVLEAHIVTSLSPGCQHLILIGDHQQLRPNPNVYTLAKDYKLDMSLFERMVKNGMKFERLRAQHRMRPEIARLMDPIYEDLENHESVLNFENIKGVSKNIFFIEHQELEEFIEEGRSRSNIHEAKYLAALCRYFILQGYQRQQITILTMYTGQLIQLKKEMPRDFFRGVRICAVDNFQGEENDIILLSLVRSNEEERIGFLRTANRVCVALSRAKKGFYCIGNIELMCKQGKLWDDIIRDMRARGNVGTALTLTCQNHPRNVIHASVSDDFRQAPEGGCMEPCKTRLDCGHTCQMVCHPNDPEHLEYQCRQKCEKACDEGHKCKRKCFQECGPCMVLEAKLMPSCLHVQQVPCHVDPKDFACRGPCMKKLPCGHQCTNLCSEKCTEKCKVKDWKSWDCGHMNEAECHVDPKETECAAPCGDLLKCEHPCAGSCGACLRGRLHKPCKAKCDRTLFCGHSCQAPCTKNCPPCKKECENECVHSKCQKTCGERCIPCMEPCAWKCEHHRCKNLCGQPCDRPRCNHPCKETLECGHPCIGMCGEPCPKKCRVCNKAEVTEILFGEEDEPDARFVELQACGHVIEVGALDNWMDNYESDSIQLKRCPKCKTPIRTNLRYGNIVKTILNDFEKVKEKLLVPDYKIAQETFRLKQLLSDEFKSEFSEDSVKIIKSMNSKTLTSEQLNMFENQINFMNLLSKFMVKIKKEIRLTSHNDPHANLLALEEAEPLRDQVFAMKATVMKLRMRFSDQELEEMRDEIMRLQLIISYRVLLTQKRRQGISFDHDENKRLNLILRIIKFGKRIDEQKLQIYMDCVEKIRKTHHLRYEPVTKEEKAMIVKAMGMRQGHWFKCPKGHYYAIGDCGGATVESKCPECKSTIGGTQHRLRSDNALAPEMDGARFAAWSDTANDMRNFELGF